MLATHRTTVRTTGNFPFPTPLLDKIRLSKKTCSNLRGTGAFHVLRSARRHGIFISDHEIRVGLYVACILPFLCLDQKSLEKAKKHKYPEKLVFTHAPRLPREGVTEDYWKTTVLAAWFHDEGKRVIPQDILLKSGPLSSEERIRVQTHPVAAENLLETGPYSFLRTETSRLFPIISAAIGSHHEKLLGNGYPYKKTREEINVGARIISVADVFDVLTASDRPYRTALSAFNAFKIIQSLSGVEFDPAVVLALQMALLVNPRDFCAIMSIKTPEQFTR